MRRVINDLLPHIVLIVFCSIILVPLLWLLRVALTNKLQAYQIPPEWSIPHIRNFVEIFTVHPFSDYFLNSVTVAIGSTLVALPLAALMAYSFARYNTGGLPLRLVTLSSQMLPPVILVLPLFNLFLKTSLLNTLPGLIIAHVTISLPFLAWLLVSFFEGDIILLEQAARIDGAGVLRTFFSVILPNAKPVFASVAILTFLTQWGAFLWPLMVTSSESVRPLPLAIATFHGLPPLQWGDIFAFGMMMVLPVLLVFLLFQPWFVRGVAATGMKG